MTEETNIDKLRNFLLTNENWEKILSSDPYNLSIKRNNAYVLMKYKQIQSDFSKNLVKASRGVIFDEEDNYKVVCRPFEKFFNWGEDEADSIDWESAKIQEKIDGSILKRWFSERENIWKMSTNGVIEGYDVPVMLPDSEVKTFGDMINRLPNILWEGNDFDEEYTYIFEIVGPYNRVVIPYQQIDLYYLTSFHNETGKEKCFLEDELNYFSRPKSYNFSSLEETIAFTRSENFNNFRNEGFVVSDKFSHRVKIKTEDYLRIHRIRGEAVPNKKKILDIVLKAEQEEFLCYFPEYKDQFLEIQNLLLEYKESLKQQRIDFKSQSFETRKEAALWIKDQKDPNFLFQDYDGKISNIDDWILDQKVTKILERLFNET